MVHTIELIMGMPITVTLVDHDAKESDAEKIFSYFRSIDETFSPYKLSSEVSKINRRDISPSSYSSDMQEIIALCIQTQDETFGYFNPWNGNTFDPSGIVKRWAIQKAHDQLKNMNYHNFYIDAGGDIAVSGVNENHYPWRIGIKNPFQQDQIIKVIALSDKAIATSGTYIRGNHIYNPYHPDREIQDIISLTVVSDTIYDADRFATAAFAMGRKGIEFIQDKEGLEGYMIDSDGMATYTDGFKKYVIEENVV